MVLTLFLTDPNAKHTQTDLGEKRGFIVEEDLGEGLMAGNGSQVAAGKSEGNGGQGPGGCRLPGGKASRTTGRQVIILGQLEVTRKIQNH